MIYDSSQRCLLTILTSCCSKYSSAWFFSWNVCQRVPDLTTFQMLLSQIGQTYNPILAKSDNYSAAIFSFESKPYRRLLMSSTTIGLISDAAAIPLTIFLNYPLSNNVKIQYPAPTIYTHINQIIITVVILNPFSIYYGLCCMMCVMHLCVFFCV